MSEFGDISVWVNSIHARGGLNAGVPAVRRHIEAQIDDVDDDDDDIGCAGVREVSRVASARRRRTR